MGNQYQFKHGRYQTPEYKVWSAMIQRCTNPKCGAFPIYGGRGIKVCERWMYSENFLADMGLRPSRGHSIDRIDVNGDYEPSNCRWTTKFVQDRNRRNNVILTYSGKTQCIQDWSRELNLSVSTIKQRFIAGWTEDEIFTLPVQNTGMRPQRLREFSGTLLKFNGESLTIEQWADRIGISGVSLRSRLRRWPFEEALTAPRGKHGPKKGSKPRYSSN